MTDGQPLESRLTDPAEPPLGTVISLHTLKAAAWRRRRIWLATALVGMILGAAFHLVVPRKYEAETKVYLVQPQGSDPAQATATDASLAETRAVANSAEAALGLHIDTDSFLSSYRATVVSDAILSITLTASTPGLAISRANAVARSFLAFRAAQFRQQTQAAVNGLNAEASKLESDINGLASSMNALSGATGPAANELAQLQGQQAGDSTQLTQTAAQIQQDEVDMTSVTRGSRLLDPATVAPVSAKRVVAADALTGLVAGLGLGLLGMVVKTALSDRLRGRQEVAVALGVPVELSVGRYQRPWLMRRQRLADRARHPGPGLQLVGDCLRGQLEASTNSALATIAVEASEPAALAVYVLATSLAEHQPVVVADLVDGHPLARLFGVEPDEAGPHRVILGGGANAVAITLVVGSDNPTQPTPPPRRDSGDVVLVLATVDPAVGAEALARWVTDAVVIVSAGKATRVQLDTTSQLLRGAGVLLRSAVLVGADPEDHSLGALVRRAPISRAPGRSVEMVRASQ